MSHRITRAAPRSGLRTQAMRPFLALNVKSADKAQAGGVFDASPCATPPRPGRSYRDKRGRDDGHRERPARRGPRTAPFNSHMEDRTWKTDLKCCRTRRAP